MRRKKVSDQILSLLGELGNNENKERVMNTVLKEAFQVKVPLHTVKIVLSTAEDLFRAEAGNLPLKQKSEQDMLLTILAENEDFGLIEASELAGRKSIWVVCVCACVVVYCTEFQLTPPLSPPVADETACRTCQGKGSKE